MSCQLCPTDITCFTFTSTDTQWYVTLPAYKSPPSHFKEKWHLVFAVFQLQRILENIIDRFRMNGKEQEGKLNVQAGTDSQVCYVHSTFKVS